MALGATQARVQLDVIWRTLRLALIGIAIGVVASLAVARLIASLLFRTAPTIRLPLLGWSFCLEVLRCWRDISLHEELQRSIQWSRCGQTENRMACSRTGGISVRPRRMVLSRTETEVAGSKLVYSLLLTRENMAP